MRKLPIIIVLLIAITFAPAQAERASAGGAYPDFDQCSFSADSPHFKPGDFIRTHIIIRCRGVQDFSSITYFFRVYMTNENGYVVNQDVRQRYTFNTGNQSQVNNFQEIDYPCQIGNTGYTYLVYGVAGFVPDGPTQYFEQLAQVPIYCG